MSTQRKVTVLGAAGGIGSCLGLLLKISCPDVDEVAMYDIDASPTPVHGIAMDISHIPTQTQIKAYGQSDISSCLSGSSVVIMLSGVAQKPGQTREDLLEINARIVYSLSLQCASYCPKAILCIISNPVNSMVPVAVSAYKSKGVYDRRRILGVTTLDVCRAQTFVGRYSGVDPQTVDVPVIGGHAGTTILTLVSQASCVDRSICDTGICRELNEEVMNGAYRVLETKKTTATFSTAYSVLILTQSILKGLNGHVSEAYAYVNWDYENVPYFSRKCIFSTEGVEKVVEPIIQGEYEKSCLQAVLDKLRVDISQGENFNFCE